MQKNQTNAKEKSTFNLSVKTLDALEEAWMKLRKEFKGQRITKTLIVEKAIEIIINDLEVKTKRNEEPAIIYSIKKSQENYHGKK